MNTVLGIASTTHVDLQNQRMSKAALEQMAEKMRSVFIPFLIDHDFNRQVGVVFTGRVEQMSDGEFALLFVAGIFEVPSDRSVYPNGAANSVSDYYQSYLDGALSDIEKQKTNNGAAAPRRIPTNVADELEMHLDSSAVWSDGTVYTVKHFLFMIADMSIEVYRDHTPPHFHVKSKQRDTDVSFHLHTLEPLAGSQDVARRKDVKKIQEFFRRQPEKLRELKTEHARMQMQ